MTEPQAAAVNPEVIAAAAQQPAGEADVFADPIFDVRNLSLWYGEKQALKSISLKIPQQRITAFIGPSGCGKSALIRCLNRLNDLVDGVRITGDVLFEGDDIFDPRLDV